MRFIELLKPVPGHLNLDEGHFKGTRGCSLPTAEGELGRQSDGLAGEVGFGTERTMRSMSLQTKEAHIGQKRHLGHIGTSTLAKFTRLHARSTTQAQTC